jgi:hypothetical protein
LAQRLHILGDSKRVKNIEFLLSPNLSIVPGITFSYRCSFYLYTNDSTIANSWNCYCTRYRSSCSEVRRKRRNTIWFSCAKRMGLMAEATMSASTALE